MAIIRTKEDLRVHISQVIGEAKERTQTLMWEQEQATPITMLARGYEANGNMLKRELAFARNLIEENHSLEFVGMVVSYDLHPMMHEALTAYNFATWQYYFTVSNGKPNALQNAKSVNRTAVIDIFYDYNFIAITKEEQMTVDRLFKLATKISSVRSNELMQILEGASRS